MVPVIFLFAQLKRLPRDVTPPKPPPPFTTSIAMILKTSDGETRATAQPDQAPAEPRPMATVHSGEKPQLRWSVKNLDARKPIKDLAVHVLVLREEAAGAKIGPGLQKGGLLDTVMGTDLAAKGATSGNYNTAVYEPGYYLVEVELLDRQGNRRGLCALDLQVK